MKWLELDPGATRYDVVGDGQLIVLLHEMGGSIESFDPLMDLLGGAGRILRYDLRGFGGASKVRGTVDLDVHVRDLELLLARLADTGTVHLCGMATGAAVALRFAARFPDRVRSLLLMSPSLGISPERRAAVLARADRIDADGMLGIADDELALTYPEPLRGDGRFADYRARWLGNDPASYAATYRMLVHLDMVRDLTAVGCPSLLLAGEQDPLRPPALISQAARMMRNARFQPLPGAHVLAFQSPSAVSEAARPLWCKG